MVIRGHGGFPLVMVNNGVTPLLWLSGGMGGFPLVIVIRGHGGFPPCYGYQRVWQLTPCYGIV